MKIKNNEKENILWVEIDKSFLSSKKNLIIGIVYISPINSTINNRVTNSNSEETFVSLYQHLLTFSNEYDILIGGDFNARTGNLLDIVGNVNKEDDFFPSTELSTIYSRVIE